MPLAQIRSPRFFAVGHTLALLIISALILIAGCSSPKAAVPVLDSGSAVAARRSDPAHSNSAAQPDPFVAAVRAGTMSGYPQATIGQAFEGAFSDAQWRSQQPDDGGRVVTFTGFLPAKMRTDCGAGNAGSDAHPCAQNARVTFEWTFASDGRLFHLSRVDPEPWPEAQRSTREILLYIFG